MDPPPSSHADAKMSASDRLVSPMLERWAKGEGGGLFRDAVEAGGGGGGGGGVGGGAGGDVQRQEKKVETFVGKEMVPDDEGLEIDGEPTSLALIDGMLSGGNDDDDERGYAQSVTLGVSDAVELIKDSVKLENGKRPLPEIPVGKEAQQRENISIYSPENFDDAAGETLIAKGSMSEGTEGNERQGNKGEHNEKDAERLFRTSK